VPTPTGPIPMLRSVAYRGAGSEAQAPVHLPSGTYHAEWGATAVGSACVFRAVIEPLEEGPLHPLPDGQTPYGGTTYGSSELRLLDGPYQVVVTARECKWSLRIDLVPTAG
jgi:hypothetical protein